MKKNRKRIKREAKTRKINFLMHFTRQENLESILVEGLIPRAEIEADELPATFNDDVRLDGCPSATSLSIVHPNYKMFYRYRKTFTDAKWAVLGIHASVLWKYKCGFCSENAASNHVTAIPIEQRSQVEAFRGMFDEIDGRPSRKELAIPDGCPTNPQAEVLVFGRIKPKFIAGVAFRDKADADDWGKRYPAYEIGRMTGLFAARKDYAHWK